MAAAGLIPHPGQERMRRVWIRHSHFFIAALRLLVLVYIFYSLISITSSIPAKYESLRSLDPGSTPFTPFYEWDLSQIQTVVETIGIRPEMVAAVRLSASLVCLLFFWVVAGMLFWRKSSSIMGPLAAYILVFTSHGFSGMLLSDAHTSQVAQNLALLLAVATWPTFFVMLYIFPNGRFIPPFTRYLVGLPYLVFILASFNSKMNPYGIAVIFAYAVGGILSQIYRYRTISTREERQQTKWVVSAVALLILSAFATPALLFFFPAWVVGSPARFWYELIGIAVLGTLLPATLPLAVGFSILRYRLWDIDLIIRRTLVYSFVTASLVLVYFGVVTILQAVFSTSSGQSSTFAVVLSTLAIAALFNPLRRRIQAFIDRRFYRQKYNAEQAAAAFASAATRVTDLEELSGKVLELIGETLQPSAASLWMKGRQPK
jgi:hypothetical protein